MSHSERIMNSGYDQRMTDMILKTLEIMSDHFEKPMDELVEAFLQIPVDWNKNFFE